MCKITVNQFLGWFQKKKKPKTLINFMIIRFNPLTRPNFTINFTLRQTPMTIHKNLYALYLNNKK